MVSNIMFLYTYLIFLHLNNYEYKCNCMYLKVEILAEKVNKNIDTALS